MEVYLVGGAVRDRLMGMPIADRDWVVVGATPDYMLAQGYRPVGKDFPVFLHPETGEEHALARRERKVSTGYHGFTFHATPSVTLEEDLSRRDLTINAIAEDADGNIVDPYHGTVDLENKILRHVSPAFAEDPVRILRLARFAARYHHLGFAVAPETYDLMRSMVANGEVDSLVPERVWKELQRALSETSPAEFIHVLKACGALAVILPEVDALFGIPQPAQHHPEIDAGVHTLMSLAVASRMSGDTRVRFAVLLHDLGKATTPKDELPRHIGHEERGEGLVKEFCRRLRVPREYSDLAIAVARYHLYAHRALDMKKQSVLKLFKAVGGLRRPQQFERFLQCCEADARGRKGLEMRPYPQADYLRQALKASLAVDVQPLIEKGFQGEVLGMELHQCRLVAIQSVKENFPA